MQVFRAFSFLVFRNYILDTKTLIRIILAEGKHFLKAERKVLKKQIELLLNSIHHRSALSQENLAQLSQTGPQRS